MHNDFFDPTLLILFEVDIYVRLFLGACNIYIYIYIYIFFLVTRGVRVSLRAPQLIPGPIKHPTNPVDK